MVAEPSPMTPQPSRTHSHLQGELYILLLLRYNFIIMNDFMCQKCRDRLIEG